MTGIGLSFGAVPDLYDEVRPEYPDEVYDAIEEAAGGIDGRAALDLAAGTGIVYRKLVSRAAAAVALDPSEPMLRRLRARSPQAVVVAGSAEALPFDPACFDLVTCATAWHWLRVAPAVAELRRVVRPGGLLALFWAVNDFGAGVEWEDAQSAVFEKWDTVRGGVPPTTEGVHPREAAGDLRARGLDVLVERETTWQRTVSRELHLQMLRTHSNNLVRSEADREQLLAEIEAVLQPWPQVTERLWGPLVIARFC